MSITINKTNLLFYVLCLCYFANAQQTSYYVRSYKLQANSYGGNIEELSDGGFINSAANIDTLIGPAPNFDTTYVEVISLYRVNKTGGIKWAKNYLLNSDCAYGGSFCLSKDSSIAIATIDIDSTLQNPDYLFFKVDQMGNLISYTAIGTLGNEYAMDIKQLSDENYLICGHSDGISTSSYVGRFNLVKLTKTGGFTFSKLYSAANSTYDFPVGLKLDKNEDAFMFGNSNDYVDTVGMGPGLGQVVRTDKDGNLKWLSRISAVDAPLFMSSYYVTCGTLNMQGKFVCGGNLSVTDTSTSAWDNMAYATLTFFNHNGTIDFSKKYTVPTGTLNSSVYFNGITQRKNRDYAVTYYSNTGAGVLILDSMGNVKNTITIDQSLYLFNIINIKNNGIAANGADFNYYHSALAKLDSNIHVPCKNDISNLVESKVIFTYTLGGVITNSGTSHPSKVVASVVNVGDSVWCNKTVTITGGSVPNPTVIPTPTNIVTADPTGTATIPTNTTAIPTPTTPTEPPIVNNPPLPNCVDDYVFIPNTFTPNGDGYNDKFFVRGLKANSFHLLIYNRWGELVFDNYDIKVGWDGSYNGRQADNGVFGWFLEVECITGEKIFKKGNLTLVR